MFNMAQMMQKAEEMQKRMQEMQTGMSNVEVEGSSGGGMVKVTATCKGDVRKIDIDPSLLKESEKEILEDLLKAALNEARRNGETKMAEETRKMMEEMGLPAGMNLPF